MRKQLGSLFFGRYLVLGIFISLVTGLAHAAAPLPTFDRSALAELIRRSMVREAVPSCELRAVSRTFLQSRVDSDVWSFVRIKVLKEAGPGVQSVEFKIMRRRAERVGRLGLSVGGSIWKEEWLGEIQITDGGEILGDTLKWVDPPLRVVFFGRGVRGLGLNDNEAFTRARTSFDSWKSVSEELTSFLRAQHGDIVESIYYSDQERAFEVVLKKDAPADLDRDLSRIAYSVVLRHMREGRARLKFRRMGTFSDLKYGVDLTKRAEPTEWTAPFFRVWTTFSSDEQLVLVRALDASFVHLRDADYYGRLLHLVEETVGEKVFYDRPGQGDRSILLQTLQKLRDMSHTSPDARTRLQAIIAEIQKS